MQMRVLGIYISNICGIVWATSSLARWWDMLPEQNEACRTEIKKYMEFSEGRVDGGKQ